MARAQAVISPRRLAAHAHGGRRRAHLGGRGLAPQAGGEELPGVVFRQGAAIGEAAQERLESVGHGRVGSDLGQPLHAGQVEEVAQGLVAAFRGDGFRVELDAVDQARLAAAGP